LFEIGRKGVALTPAGKSFLIDARSILEDRETSFRKAQRISRGEVGELAIGYISALTHEFLGKALKVWRLTSPGIIVDCIETDSVSQERAPLEGICRAAFSIGRLRGTPQREQNAHVLYDSWHRRFCGWA
jgi:DNA-binding transcriptional LysR family regulator